MVALLLEAGADPQARTQGGQQGRTPADLVPPEAVEAPGEEPNRSRDPGTEGPNRGQPTETTETTEMIKQGEERGLKWSRGLVVLAGQTRRGEGVEVVEGMDCVSGLLER